MATFAKLIERTAVRLSQVAGSSVQLYSEDRIAEMVQHKFDVLFDEAFWGQFVTFGESMTLDGSTGVVTTDLSSKIKRFDDIRVIFPDDSNTPLSALPEATLNPDTITGTTPAFYSPSTSALKVFKIWPLASTGSIQVTYRTKPDAFVDSDVVDFDDQALILGAAFDYAEDDGTNPAATDKLQNMFESRVKQLRNMRNETPIALDNVSRLPNSFTFTELAS
jgi:hypothetical protein